MSSPTKKDWKKIRALQWSQEAWQRMFDFLHSGELPENMSVSAATRFKRHMKWLSLSDGGEDIVLRTADRVYRVIPADQVDEILQKSWSDVKTNSYRGVHSFYDRLAKETIGISKQKVRDFLSNQELQQLDLRSQPEMQRRVVKPLRPERPFQWWQIGNQIGFTRTLHALDRSH